MNTLPIKKKLCSACNKEKPLGDFLWEEARDIPARVCDKCSVGRIRRRIAKRLDGQRCSKCDGKPTPRDVVEAMGNMTWFRDEFLCSNCLVPDISDEEIMMFLYDQSMSSNMDWGSYAEPEAIDWFGDDTAKDFTQ